MKYFLISLFCLSFSFCLRAQEVQMKTKEVQDTILGNRALFYSGSFDAEKALYQLFPGKLYHKGKQLIINWTCTKYKPFSYYDVNGAAAEATTFPYESGVATRLMNEMDFKDANGTAYKIISFNHSVFDPEGIQMLKYQGGALGLAKFVFTNNGWKLRMFTPVIGGFGAYSQAPTPKPLLIGEDQYAFTVAHYQAGGGGVFITNLYLVAGINGVYKNVMEAEYVGKEDEISAWNYDVTTSGDKKQFKDIVVKISGTYVDEDAAYMPEEVLPLIKGKKRGSFTAEEKYVFNGKNYVLQKPVIVTAK